MTLFRHPDLKSAYRLVQSGGQALYVRRAFRKEPPSGWLIDNDPSRLYETAKRFGIRNVRLLRQGRDGQCCEITGAALDRAIAECQTPEIDFE